IAAEPLNQRAWRRRRVDEGTALGEREAGSSVAHEIGDVVHDRTRLAAETRAARVEGLDDQRALSNVGEVSRSDELRARFHPRDHATALRVERAKAQLTRRAGPRHVGEVDKTPAVGQKAWPEVGVFRWSDRRHPDRVSATIRQAEEPACTQSL